MRKRAFAWVCTGIWGACAGGGQQSDVTAAATAPTYPDFTEVARDAGSVQGEPSSPDRDADATDASIVRPPERRVRLAPVLEDALKCDNVDLTFDFEANSRAFNLDHAFWMMWFAERAFFAATPETRTELAEVGFDRYESFADANTGLELYVAASEASVIVAFRGSNETKDWLADFNFPQDDGAAHGVAGKVHRGFATALSPTFDAIAATVRAFASDGQMVWVTGHSLGGAEATLTATRLSRTGSRLGPLYTYGAPRAGDAAFARDASKQLGERVYRIVNELDLVPRLPPAAIAADEAARVLPFGHATASQTVRDLDYRHVGQMMWLPYPSGNDLTAMPLMSDAEDQPYWADTAQDGSIGLLAGSQQQGARHAQQRYLCRLFDLRNTQLVRPEAYLWSPAEAAWPREAPYGDGAPDSTTVASTVAQRLRSSGVGAGIDSR